MELARANWIAGRSGPARHGGTFAPDFAGDLPEDELAWPASGIDDVARAFDAARAGGAWTRRSEDERARALLAAARALESDHEGAALVARPFELDGADVARHTGDLERELERCLGERRAARDPGGVALVAPDWRDLFARAFLEVALELHAGRSVVLVSDARLPWCAERVAAALVAGEVDAGALSLLHGAPRELLRAALEQRGWAALRASGSVERIVELRRACEAAGIGDPVLRTLRCAPFEVDPTRALDETARAVVEGAFGRSVLGGQLAGSLARVFCPERSFSRFSELLLECLHTSPLAREPVPLIDRETKERARRAAELGLDEGATPISGGELGARALGRRLAPVVFTNVEPYMISAQRQEPLPVLCLLRSNSTRPRARPLATGAGPADGG